MNIDKALNEYADKFEDNFPIMAVMDLEEKEIVELIKKAIEKDKPYEADYEDGGVY